MSPTRGAGEGQDGQAEGSHGLAEGPDGDAEVAADISDARARSLYLHLWTHCPL